MLSSIETHITCDGAEPLSPPSGSAHGNIRWNDATLD